jgi:hypothetical protein
LKNPIQAFVEWFQSLAVGHRQYLAHMFFVLTTQNTTDLAMAKETSPDRFLSYVVKKDFPVRVVARMVVIRGIFDFILLNKDELLQETPGAPSIVNISEKHWEKGFESWRMLRGKELSDIYTQMWLKAELKSLGL